MEVQPHPAGTLAEQIRCGGCRAGRFLTPTGVGAVVEERQTRKLPSMAAIISSNFPPRADLALLIPAQKPTRSAASPMTSVPCFNPLMALAADITIAGPDEMVAVGISTRCVATGQLLTG